MMRGGTVLCFLLFLSALYYPSSVESREQLYDSRFLGISYEYAGYVMPEADSLVERVPPRGAGAYFTYGHPGVRFPRLRAGVGWEPERPLYASVGLEIPLVERFNPAAGRSFGLFLLSDVSFGFWQESRVTLEPKLSDSGR